MLKVSHFNKTSCFTVAIFLIAYFALYAVELKYRGSIVLGFITPIVSSLLGASLDCILTFIIIIIIMVTDAILAVTITITITITVFIIVCPLFFHLFTNIGQDFAAHWIGMVSYMTSDTV